MTVSFCDVCGLPLHGVEPDRFRAQGAMFDVGPCCLEKPFRVPEPDAWKRWLARAIPEAPHGEN